MNSNKTNKMFSKENKCIYFTNLSSNKKNENKKIFLKMI